MTEYDDDLESVADEEQSAKGDSSVLTAVSVILIVFGGIGILFSLIGIASSLVMHQAMQQQMQGMMAQMSWFQRISFEYGAALQTWGLLWSAALLAAGIGLLQRANWARIIGLVACGYFVIEKIFYLVLTAAGQFKQVTPPGGPPPGMAGMMSTFATAALIIGIFFNLALLGFYIWSVFVLMQPRTRRLCDAD